LWIFIFERLPNPIRLFSCEELMTPFPPPGFYDFTVRKNYKIIGVGLAIHDEDPEGATVNFHGLHASGKI